MFSHLSGLNFALDASYVFELKYSGRRPVCWSFFVTGCLLGEKGEGCVLYFLRNSFCVVCVLPSSKFEKQRKTYLMTYLMSDDACP